MMHKNWGAGGWNSCETIIDRLRSGWLYGYAQTPEGERRKRFKNSELKAVIERFVGLDRRTYKKYRKLLLKLKWIRTNGTYHILVTDEALCKERRHLMRYTLTPAPESKPVLAPAPVVQNRFCYADKHLPNCGHIITSVTSAEPKSTSYWDNPV